MDESLGYIEAACGQRFQILDDDGVLDQEATATKVRRHTPACSTCDAANEPATTE